MRVNYTLREAEVAHCRGSGALQIFLVGGREGVWGAGVLCLPGNQHPRVFTQQLS